MTPTRSRPEFAPILLTALAFALAGQLGCVSPRDTPLPPTEVPGGGTPPRPGAVTDGPLAPAPDDGPPPSQPDPADPGAPTTCQPGQQFCEGLGCVDPASPDHCGRSCAPCPTISGGTTTCDGNKCGITCPTGMEPCLDRCVPAGTVCGGCPAMKRPCNGLCVDLTNLAACGEECTPCTTSPFGTATCNGTSCELECKPGYHKCEDNTCRSDRDWKSCGTSCTPCPVPDGGEATCNGTTCGTRCPPNTMLCPGAGACIPMNAPCLGVCPSGRHECGGNCVPNDVNFCGPACKQCRAPDDADAKCDGSDCTFSCRSGFRECAGACLANDRPCNGSCPSGSKVCGDRCVSSSTCCTDGRQGCNECFSCSNGTCNRQADGTGCGNNQVCRTGSCVACGDFGETCCVGNSCSGGLSCLSGLCRECMPGQRSCRDASTPQRCDNGRLVTETCAGVCQGAGMCVGNCRGSGGSCQGNTHVQCVNNNLMRQECPTCTTCESSGCSRVSDGTSCGNNRICRGGSCSACGGLRQPCCGGQCTGGRMCLNNSCVECNPSFRECGNNETPRTCNNGQIVTGQPCQGICRNGACQGNCRPGTQPRCAGDTGPVETCGNNAMTSRMNCPGPSRGTGSPSCSGGQCQAPRCSGNTPVPCGNNGCCQCDDSSDCRPGNGFAGVCLNGTCDKVCEDGTRCGDDSCRAEVKGCGALARSHGADQCTGGVITPDSGCDRLNSNTTVTNRCDVGTFTHRLVPDGGECPFDSLLIDACRAFRAKNANNPAENFGGNVVSFAETRYNEAGNRTGEVFVGESQCP